MIRYRKQLATYGSNLAMRLSSLCVLLLALSYSANTLAAIKVYVDKAVVSIDETIELSVETDQSFNFTQQDISRIEANFSIVGRFTSNNYSLINGNFQRTISRVLQLRPHTTGKFLIPSLTIGSDQSQAIEIIVNAARQKNTSLSDSAYIETSIEKANSFVQEQNILSYKLFSPQAIFESQIQAPKIKDAEIIELNRLEYQQLVNGTSYFVHEFRFAIFPQKSGELFIPQTILNASVNDAHNYNSRFSLNFGRKIINLQSPEASITIKAVPKQHSQQWLPASAVVVEQTWQNNLSNIAVGETVIRDIRIRANGVLPEHFNKLSFSEIEHLKLYPDGEQKELSIDKDGVVTTISQRLSYIPTQPGQYVLEPVTITWWDTRNATLQTTHLKAQTITVVNPNGTVNNTIFSQDTTNKNANAAPANNSGSAQTANNPALDKEAQANSNSGKSLIYKFAIGLLILSLLVLTALLIRWHLKRRRATQTSALRGAEHLEEIKSACLRHDLGSLQQALINWARYNWPQHNIVNLNAIGQTLRDESAGGHISEQLTKELEQLESALYSAHKDTWQPDTLSALIDSYSSTVNKPHNAKHFKQHTTQSLPDIYPE